MTERTVMDCIDGVAHGFEIVQSIFPGWEFAAADAVAIDGLHGALVVGPWHTTTAHPDDWLQTLSTFEIDLMRNGALVDHGRAENVLGGPLSALRYLVALLAREPVNPPLAAGDIVTTGTLTRVLPMAPGESWSTAISGLALDGIDIRFV
jgi:2-oxo-3-hexenedioate decarboxylase